MTLMCFACRRPISLGEVHWRGYEPGSLRAIVVCADCHDNAEIETEGKAGE